MKYWFKPKTYGYGFVPVSWEGWLMTLCLILLMLGSVYINNFFSPMGPSPEQAIRFLIDLTFAIGTFCYFAEKKTDGELRFRWGKRD